MTKFITIVKEIVRCWETCPYYAREQGGVMFCQHHKAINLGYIITDESKNGFPPLCPLPETSTIHI